MKFKRQINNITHLHRRLTISREIPLARVRRSQGSAVRGTKWDSTFTASLTSCQFFGSRPLTVCFQRFQVETRFQPQFATTAKSFICSINLSFITFAKSHVSFLSDLDDLVFRTRQKSYGEQFFFEEPMFWSLKYFFLFSMTSKLKQKLCPQDFPKRVREHRAVLTRFAKEVFLQKILISKSQSMFSGLEKKLLLFQQQQTT